MLWLCWPTATGSDEKAVFLAKFAHVRLHLFVALDSVISLWIIIDVKQLFLIHFVSFLPSVDSHLLDHGLVPRYTKIQLE